MPETGSSPGTGSLARKTQLRHSPDVRDQLTTAARELVVAPEALEQQDTSAP